jgi:hypothetical protein
VGVDLLKEWTAKVMKGFDKKEKHKQANKRFFGLWSSGSSPGEEIFDLTPEEEEQLRILIFENANEGGNVQSPA